MDLRKILNKKKLRGDEVGRVLLAETVYSYKEAKKGNDTAGVFTEAERDKMVDGLTTSQDWKDYTSYKSIDRTIYKYVGLAQANLQMFFNGFYQTWGMYSKILEAEKAIEYIEGSPVVMTDKQYKEERTKAQEIHLAKKISYQELAYKALHYSMKNPDSPTQKAIDALEGQQITNPRIIETYPTLMGLGHTEYPDGSRPKQRTEEEIQDQVDKAKAEYEERALDWEKDNLRSLTLIDHINGVPDPTALKVVFDIEEDGIDKKQLLEYIENLLEWEALYGVNFQEFIEDYPEVYKALQAEISSHPELAPLEGVTDYQEGVVPWEVLYKGNLYDYKKLLDSDSFLFPDIERIAILRDPRKYDLDERGYFTPKPTYFKGFKDLYHNEDNRQFIQRAKNEFLIPSYRMIIAINTFFTLLAERLDMADLEIFKTPTDVLYERISVYNVLLYLQFQYTPSIKDPEERELMAALVKEVLTPIDLHSYDPTEPLIEEARSLLDDLSQIEDNAIAFITLLEGFKEGGL